MSRFALGSRDPQQPNETFGEYQDRTNNFCIEEDNPNKDLLETIVSIVRTGGEDNEN